MLKKTYLILFIPYTILLLYLLFLGFGRIQYEENIVRLVPIKSTYVFIQKSILWQNIIINILGNIIMFIPFGFLGWALPTLKDLKTLILNFLFVIIMVEALQYFTRMGIFDIDDIFLNTFGVWIGFKIFQWINKKFYKIK